MSSTDEHLGGWAPLRSAAGRVMGREHVLSARLGPRRYRTACGQEGELLPGRPMLSTLGHCVRCRIAGRRTKR